VLRKRKSIPVVRTAIVVTIVSLEAFVAPINTLAWGQVTPAEAAAGPAPSQLEGASCWSPSLARNIGIAEPSCNLFIFSYRNRIKDQKRRATLIPSALRPE
jgi:hypothetical protein